MELSLQNDDQRTCFQTIAPAGKQESAHKLQQQEAMGGGVPQNGVRSPFGSKKGNHKESENLQVAVIGKKL